MKVKRREGEGRPARSLPSPGLEVHGRRVGLRSRVASGPSQQGAPLSGWVAAVSLLAPRCARRSGLPCCAPGARLVTDGAHLALSTHGCRPLVHGHGPVLMSLSPREPRLWWVLRPHTPFLWLLGCCQPPSEQALRVPGSSWVIRAGRVHHGLRPLPAVRVPG